MKKTRVIFKFFHSYRGIDIGMSVDPENAWRFPCSLIMLQDPMDRPKGYRVVPAKGDHDPTLLFHALHHLRQLQRREQLVAHLQIINLKGQTLGAYSTTAAVWRGEGCQKAPQRQIMHGGLTFSLNVATSSEFFDPCFS